MMLSSGAGILAAIAFVTLVAWAAYMWAEKPDPGQHMPTSLDEQHDHPTALHHGTHE